MKSRIAYFVNRYPAVSHSFIRREIHGLEALGMEVERIALRGWDGELVDEVDHDERAATHYILGQSQWRLLQQVFTVFRGAPDRFLSALGLALRMGWRGTRPMPYHLGYLIEACALLQRLQQVQAAHVHAHFGTNSAEIVMLANALGGPPYSFTVHGPEEFDSPGPLGLGEKVRRSAFTVAITSYARAQLYRWVEHGHWHKVKVVHCALEPGFFTAPPVPVPSEPRFVCIGRLNEQKGQLLLLEAARILHGKGIAFEIVLIGNGELRSQLDDTIRRYGLQQQVHLAGAVSTEQMRAEIQRARALVLPSFAEGLPMVIMEVMGLRRPVLTTWVAGIPELVRHGTDGWLIPPGSVEHLVQGMEAVLATSTEDLQRMGDSAWLRARERHSLDNQARELERLIAESAALPVTQTIAASVEVNS